MVSTCLPTVTSGAKDFHILPLHWFYIQFLTPSLPLLPFPHPFSLPLLPVPALIPILIRIPFLLYHSWDSSIPPDYVPATCHCLDEAILDLCFPIQGATVMFKFKEWIWPECAPGSFLTQCRDFAVDQSHQAACPWHTHRNATHSLGTQQGTLLNTDTVYIPAWLDRTRKAPSFP